MNSFRPWKRWNVLMYNSSYDFDLLKFNFYKNMYPVKMFLLLFIPKVLDTTQNICSVKQHLLGATVMFYDLSNSDG